MLIKSIMKITDVYDRVVKQIEAKDKKALIQVSPFKWASEICVRGPKVHLSPFLCPLVAFQARPIRYQKFDFVGPYWVDFCLRKFGFIGLENLAKVNFI